ncbi:MAG: CRISPR-associated endonuclease Cas2 [Beijerinckiaceae bacterium]
MSANSLLSGYRVLWIMALFDLPVLTKPERKRATKFRQFLLDEGFMMMQFSCYIRFTAGKEQAEAITKRVGKAVPSSGKVDVIWFTDKQYENIQSFRGHGRESRPPKPDQLTLF